MDVFQSINRLISTHWSYDHAKIPERDVISCVTTLMPNWEFDRAWSEIQDVYHDAQFMISHNVRQTNSSNDGYFFFTDLGPIVAFLESGDD